MQSVTDLLQQLIRIPSVNPEGDPGTDQTGEQKIADWLAGFLGDAGFDVALEDVEPGRPNLIARCPGPDDRPRILLGPHLDTVGVGGMTIDPFGGEIHEGRIWGRGASDTKGPMAAMIWGLLENRELLERLPVAVDFVAFMGEESNQWGSKHFAGRHCDEYAFAIAGEPTSLDIVHATKGSLWITLRAGGLAAHASQPERGENAIVKLANVIGILDRELSPELANFTHPVLGKTTLSINIIEGGTRANVVPDHATAQLDIRFTPDLVAGRSAFDFVSRFIEERGLQVEATAPTENPPMDVPADNEWLRKLREIHPASKLVGAPWFSDAAHLNDRGVPSICLGPGSIDQAHTVDEFIEIADLDAGAAYFAKLVRSL